MTVKESTWVQRVAGILGAYAVTYAARKGLTLDVEQTIAVFSTIFTAVEFLVAKRTNPDNVVTK